MAQKIHYKLPESCIKKEPTTDRIFTTKNSIRYDTDFHIGKWNKNCKMNLSLFSDIVYWYYKMIYCNQR